MDEFTFGSLFTGIGGFDLGFERAGMCCVWQAEIDDRCNEVLAYHWPRVDRLKDVKDVGRHNLKTVDLICGGFPCQDVSVAGRREGLDGERSGLWFEFIRIVEELKPKWVIVENVPGLLSSNERRDFAVILSGLGQRGYWWAYRILDAQYYGVPQRRRRVFVVGCLTRGCAQEVLFERESSPWDTPPGREARESVAASLTKRFGGCSNQWPPINEADNLIVQHALSAHNQRNDPDGEHFVVCNALDGHSGVRRLTPTECERLQGFPNGWTAVNGMSDSARYRMLGNAVCVLVAEWIGRRIMVMEQAIKHRPEFAG